MTGPSKHLHLLCGLITERRKFGTVTRKSFPGCGGDHHGRRRRFFDSARTHWRASFSRESVVRLRNNTFNSFRGVDLQKRHRVWQRFLHTTKQGRPWSGLREGLRWVGVVHVPYEQVQEDPKCSGVSNLVFPLIARSWMKCDVDHHLPKRRSCPTTTRFWRLQKSLPQHAPSLLTTCHQFLLPQQPNGRVHLPRSIQALHRP